jgi:N-acetylmuramoyl-L-alanine amidase
LEEELIRRGAAPFVLLPEEAGASDSELARAANMAGAEVMVRISLVADPEAAVLGVATVYYGREGWHSQAGLLLAELIRRELIAELSLQDRGSHARSLPILRETRMPAVQVEPVTTENPPHDALPAEPSWRVAFAKAIANGIETFFAGKGPTDSDGVPPVAPPEHR